MMPESAEKAQPAQQEKPDATARAAPLTHYRRADAARREHVDAMQDEVFEKVAAVMESFKTSPAGKTRDPDSERAALKIRQHEMLVPAKPQSLNWLFIVLIGLGGVLMLVGWRYLF